MRVQGLGFQGLRVLGVSVEGVPFRDRNGSGFRNLGLRVYRLVACSISRRGRCRGDRRGVVQTGKLPSRIRVLPTRFRVVGPRRWGGFCARRVLVRRGPVSEGSLPVGSWSVVVDLLQGVQGLLYIYKYIYTYFYLYAIIYIYIHICILYTTSTPHRTPGVHLRVRADRVGQDAHHVRPGPLVLERGPPPYSPAGLTAQ